MPEEVSSATTEAVTKTSDGTVKISVERYEELLETIASQKTSIADFRSRLARAMNEPPVINRTIVHKTPEMLSQEHRAWGGTFMGLGASLFVIGAFRYRRA